MNFECNWTTNKPHSDTSLYCMSVFFVRFTWRRVVTPVRHLVQNVFMYLFVVCWTTPYATRTFLIISNDWKTGKYFAGSGLNIMNGAVLKGWTSWPRAKPRAFRMQVRSVITGADFFWAQWLPRASAIRVNWLREGCWLLTSHLLCKLRIRGSITVLLHSSSWYANLHVVLCFAAVGV